MAKKRTMPHGLALWRPAYGIVNFHGVPMYRNQAWALLDYELSGKPLQVWSANRDEKVIRNFNAKYGTHLHSQQFLYDGWRQHLPGFNPANPPWLTSHAGHADGNPVYGPPGRRLRRYKWGIDATNVPGGDAAGIVSYLNSHGYHATRPYSSPNERHHFSFTKSPTWHARRRLRRWLRTGHLNP